MPTANPKPVIKTGYSTICLVCDFTIVGSIIDPRSIRRFNIFHGPDKIVRPMVKPTNRMEIRSPKK